jgi:dTDP-4-amino-4,6-dideoxygalactose transaminase
MATQIATRLKVPLLDLKCYHESIGSQLRTIWDELLSTSAFVAGPQVEEFEGAFARFCGVNHAIGVANGTDALILAMRALGVGQGDEVVTAANGFVATAEAIVGVGASPVFVDIDERTCNIDVHLIESHISDRTKAIIPVHLYGQPADMDPILQIAQKYNLYVIEDAAQAHGALYHGRRAGSMGDLSCFSFYPGKNLGACGDGGAVVTNNAELSHIIRLLRDHGGIKKYQHDRIGCNSRLDTLQAAILLLKLKDLPARNRARQSHAALYDSLLSCVPGVMVPEVLSETQGVFHLYVIRIENGSRDKLQQFLAERGIQTGIHYPTIIPETPAFSCFKSSDFPVAKGASKKILSLPMFPELTGPQIEYVAQSISHYFI